MKVILNSGKIDEVISDLADRIFSDISLQQDIAVVGVRSRGVVLARRLCRRLSEKCAREIPCGTLDITLHRDDLDNPQGTQQPRVKGTEINFDITDKIIILVDDVLYTGRSTRAAMDALVYFGRPKAIRLAVLVDRGARELPIQADYIGFKADVAKNESVNVYFRESDSREEVVVE